ncbi:hypothetical protein [Sulfuricaulis sp.]
MRMKEEIRRYKADWKRRNPDKDAASRLRSKERDRERTREWKVKNPEYMASYLKKWREKNRDRFRAGLKAWRQNNPVDVLLDRMKRKRSLRQAIPSWADKDLIRDMYFEGRYHRMHVDHIIPLKGKNVCGLHWEGNLQLLEPIDNLRKCNILVD